jgi:hypothetical protein
MHFTDKDKHWLRGKNQMEPQNRQEILISDKTDFRLILVRRNNDGNFILVKGKIHQEKMQILNIYVQTSVHPFKKKHYWIQAQIDSNTIIVKDFNIPLFYK